jgi:hypothetical protein
VADAVVTIRRAMTPRCLTCRRFVNPAKCNHYLYVGTNRVEYECERCAVACPWDQPPRRLAFDEEEN